MEPATVTVQLTLEDLSRFRRFAGKEPKFNRKGLVFFVLIVIIMTASFLMAPDIPATRPAKRDAIWGDAIPVVVFVGLCFYFFRRHLTGRKNDPNAFLYRPHTFAVREKGLYCETERGEMLHYWNAVVRFAENEQDFFIMISRDSGHILPKRCFPSLEDAAVFANQLRLRLEDYTPLRFASHVSAAHP